MGDSGSPHVGTNICLTKRSRKTVPRRAHVVQVTVAGT